MSRTVRYPKWVRQHTTSRHIYHIKDSPPSSFRQQWRRQARTAIKRQNSDSVITKIRKLTSIYDWY